jgi:putative ABC transport system substrate-binding protein
MRRREFIALMGASGAWPFAALAQEPDRMRRIGVLMGFPNDAQGQARVTVIRQELLRLGWAVGRNAHIDISLGRRRSRAYSDLCGRTCAAQTRRNHRQ